MALGSSNSNRRDFLVGLLTLAGQVTITSTAMYSVNLVTSAGGFSRIIAGAKEICYCGINCTPLQACDGACYDKLIGPDGCNTPNEHCETVISPNGTCGGNPYP